MPLNHTKLEKRLAECNTKLEEIFNKYLESEAGEITSRVKAVQEYYNLSYEKAQKNKTIEEIVNSYELYVLNLEKLKNKTITYEEVETSINDSNDSRKIAVILCDLAKICELVFWAATALTLYASVFLFALPMLLVQTPVGIGVSVAIGGFLIKTAVSAIECVSEFKTFTRHDKEYVHEMSLLSFFKPQSTEQPIVNEKSDSNACCY